MSVATRILTGLLGAGILSVVLSVHAQEPKLLMNYLDKLAARAVESIEVSLDEAQLQFVRNLARFDRNDRTGNKERLAKFSSIHVRMYEFAQDGEYAESDVEPIRAELRGHGWERFAREAINDGRNNDAFVMRRNGEIVGYAAIYSDARKFCLINITGRMRQEDVRELNLSDCSRWNGNHHRRGTR